MFRMYMTVAICIIALSYKRRYVMCFLDGLLSTLQDWDNKSNEYYSQYVGMSTEALKQEYKRVGGTSSRGMA